MLKYNAIDLSNSKYVPNNWIIQVKANVLVLTTKMIKQKFEC